MAGAGRYSRSSRQELLAHSKCEEREFYTVLQRNDEISDKIEHAYEEHAEVEEGLQELSDMEEEDEEWMSKFAELREDLEHHIKEEEGELFPKAREILGEEAEESAGVSRKRKSSIVRPKTRHPKTERRGAAPSAAKRAPARAAGDRGGEDVGSLTRDELYERARKLGIDGRSKMTKNELARAVRARG
jgi:hypothetical protein